MARLVSTGPVANNTLSQTRPQVARKAPPPTVRFGVADIGGNRLLVALHGAQFPLRDHLGSDG